MTEFIKDNVLSFEGRTIECYNCRDGKHYDYTETCLECQGKKTFPKNGRNYKCKKCKGCGYTGLPERKENGNCRRCDGKMILPLTAYDTMSAEDKLWIFDNLFNFDKPYVKSYSSFNEGYLGIGIVCGVTDYGRHQEMTDEEFKNEVKDNFINGYRQYVSVIKEGKLPKEILIRKGESGWHAYGNY